MSDSYTWDRNGSGWDDLPNFWPRVTQQQSESTQSTTITSAYIGELPSSSVASFSEPAASLVLEDLPGHSGHWDLPVPDGVAVSKKVGITGNKPCTQRRAY